MTATGGGRRLHGQGREGGRGDVVAVDDAAREGEHVLLLWTKPWDGRGYCPLRDHGGCRCERGRQANVGDRVKAGEPPGARWQAFLTAGDCQEAALTASGRWVLHARDANTTTQLSTATL